MLRRSYLKILYGLSTLPFIPNLTPEPRLPADGHLMYWFHFRSAIKREKSMSTERSREHVVNEMAFKNTTEQEAIRALERADAGYYTLDDIPENWRSYFENVEQSLERL